MKITPYISLLLAFYLLTACAGSKMIIESGKSKHTIELKTSVAITLKGEPYRFDENCTNTCKLCDSVLVQSRWTVDSLSEDAIRVRYVHSYVMDTITNKEFKSLSRADRKEDLLKVIVIDKKPAYVYKIPDHVEQKVIRLDQMEYITYSDRAQCYKGSPIKSIFNNPNEIRKITMQGSLIVLKLKN
jgi:hypothetical protein